MKKIIGLMLVFFAFWGISSSQCFAGESGHYVNGVEGIRAATLPPPGIYWRMYNVFYNADKITDKDGDEMNMDFDVSVYAMSNRFIWMSDVKFLGANYAADMIIPVINTDFKMGAMGIEHDKFGLGDILIEPIVLSWHGARYDASAAFGIFLPTGQYDKDNLASPGKDFWTGMFTLGGTYYLDPGKTVSASILSRYEIHSEKDETDVQPGDDFHFEWGIGKTVEKICDIGVVGYCHWQVSDDSGSDATDTDVHDRVFAAGPEVSVFIPSATLAVSLRSLWEFNAVDRSEGSVTTLTLTKRF